VPSYRVILTVGALRPGTPPEDVVPTAAAAAGALAVVEASGVDVVRGEARITVRFTADDADSAAVVAERTAEGTEAVAEVLSWRLTERVGGRWRALF
jgi:type V secretory pathway adhesin AidA